MRGAIPVIGRVRDPCRVRDKLSSLTHVTAAGMLIAIWTVPEFKYSMNGLKSSNTIVSNGSYTWTMALLCTGNSLVGVVGRTLAEGCSLWPRCGVAKEAMKGVISEVWKVGNDKGPYNIPPSCKREWAKRDGLGARGMKFVKSLAACL